MANKCRKILGRVWWATFKKIYGVRSDAESINREMEDSLDNNRSHSLGQPGLSSDLLGFGLVVNSRSLALYRASLAREDVPPDLAQAA